MSPEIRNGIVNGEPLASGWRSGRVPAERRSAPPRVRPGVELDAALYEDIMVVLGELDLLLGRLPESTIREFSVSETFPRYQRLLQTFLDAPVEGNPRL